MPLGSATRRVLGNDIGENHTIALAANRGSVRLRSETGNQDGEVVQTSHVAASGAGASCPNRSLLVKSDRI
jgi:hypothetical protein